VTGEGKVQAVVTSEGEIATETLVIAAGAWSGQLGKMIGVDIPIQPVRRQIAVTTPIRELPPDFPFVLFFSQSLYFHPESGQSILTGKSNNTEPVGFNTEVDPRWTEVHLLEAMHRFPLRMGRPVRSYARRASHFGQVAWLGHGGYRRRV
jgi:sarcosine oxidase subunit beta